LVVRRIDGNGMLALGNCEFELKRL